MNKFAYRLRNTGSSSQRLGKCEVCDAWDNTLYLQTREWKEWRAANPPSPKNV